MKQAANKSLVHVINRKEEFTFRPYVYTPLVPQEVLLSCRDTVDHLALAMAVVVAPTPLPSKMKYGEGFALYSPQRVLRQLRMIEGGINYRGLWELFSPIAEAQFIGDV